MKARYISQLFSQPLCNKPSKNEKKILEIQMQIIEIQNQSQDKLPDPQDTRIKKTNFTSDNEKILDKIQLKSRQNSQI